MNNRFLKYITVERCVIGVLVLVVAGLVVWNINEDAAIQQIEPANATEASTPQTPMPDPVRVHKHASAINKLDSDAEVLLSRVAQLIIHDEGVRGTPYLDTTGNVTIGVGRSLTTNGISVAEIHAIVDDIDYRQLLLHTHVQNGRIHISSLELAKSIFNQPLSEDDVHLLLTDDLNNVRKEAESVFGDDWQEIDGVRKEVIIDVLFNVGLPHFKQFVKFIAAVREQNWEVAATELLASHAARQNITRYHLLSTLLLTADDKYYELR